MVRLLLVAALPRRRSGLRSLGDGARRQRPAGAHGDQCGRLAGALNSCSAVVINRLPVLLHRMSQNDRSAVDIDLVHVGIVHWASSNH